MDKDTKGVMNEMLRQGFTAKTTSKQHVVIRKDGRFVTTLAGTGSDWRGLRNAIADARRFGFQWPPPER